MQDGGAVYSGDMAPDRPTVGAATFHGVNSARFAVTVNDEGESAIPMSRAKRAAIDAYIDSPEYTEHLAPKSSSECGESQVKSLASTRPSIPSDGRREQLIFSLGSSR